MVPSRCCRACQRRAADLVPQPRQHDAGARCEPQPRVCDSAGDRRRPRPSRPPAAHRGIHAGPRRRVAGLGAAYLGSALLLGSMTRIMPMTIALDPTPDVRVVGATVAFAALATIVFGLWPALRLSRTDTVRALNDQTGGLGGARRWFSTGNLLVTAQMALSLALLVASGALRPGRAARRGGGSGLRTRSHGACRGRSGARRDSTRCAGGTSAPAARADALAAGGRSGDFASVIPFGNTSMTRQVQADGPRLRGNEPGARDKLVGAPTTSSAPTISGR